MLFVATGGAELVEERPGVIVAFGLPSEQKSLSVSYADQVTFAALALAAVSIAYAVVKGRKR